jgi:glyoxylase-like metal-dependent hydrolase (beta-lactamase superfamily II)
MDMITLGRRRFIQITTAGAVSTVGYSFSVPRMAWATAPFSSQQPAGFYRLKLGEFQITAVSDGFFELPTNSIATNVPEEERKAYFNAHFISLDKFRLQASPLLINTGAKFVLVDTGVGPDNGWAPGAGRLGQTLNAAGIDPEAIDTLVLTHGHVDHIGGLVDRATGALRFPKAEVVLSDVELDIWTAADAATRVPEWAVGNLESTQRIFAALRDRLRPIKAGSDVVTGIQSLDTRGHTQGHLSLLVGSGRDVLLVTGDAIANIHIAFERPDWQIIWDHDREQGARSRVRLLDQSVADRLLVTGYHYPFPGIGHVVRNGAAYRWLPADWDWSL